MTRLVVGPAMFLAGCGLPLPCMALGLVDDAKMRRDSAGIATSGGDPYLSEDHIQCGTTERMAMADQIE